MIFGIYNKRTLWTECIETMNCCIHRKRTFWRVCGYNELLCSHRVNTSECCVNTMNYCIHRKWAIYTNCGIFLVIEVNILDRVFFVLFCFFLFAESLHFGKNVCITKSEQFRQSLWIQCISIFTESEHFGQNGIQ